MGHCLESCDLAKVMSDGGECYLHGNHSNVILLLYSDRTSCLSFVPSIIYHMSKKQK